MQNFLKNRKSERAMHLQSKCIAYVLHKHLHSFTFFTFFLPFLNFLSFLFFGFIKKEYT